MLDTKQQYKIRKFITELKKYRGRHTELVSVYIPAGYDIIKIIQHLAQEQGTASNIKDKTTRLNVQTALERMIRHLRLYSKTPENGLAAFSGNIASQEGKQDIKVWSIEPPVPVNIRLYRCDQTFVLEHLESMMHTNEVYGLIVLDNREATVGLLRGKAIQIIRGFTSSVPGKVKVGGWCLDPESLVLMANGGEKKLLELRVSDKVRSYDLKNLKFKNSKIINIWHKKTKKVVYIHFGNEKIISSLEHLFFIFTNEHKLRKLPANKILQSWNSDFEAGYFTLVNSKLNAIPISKMKVIKNSKDLIDIETTMGNFIANNILVHNSQQRYARLREEAANEFYKRIAEVANVEFASEGKDLKGILIGGPGPTKETFANGDYLHNELKKKVVGIMDITYTDEHGLHELVNKAQDALAEAEITKEKAIVNEFMTLLSTSSDKAIYGASDVMKALEYGAVDKLLLSEAFDRVDEFEAKANEIGAKVFIISVETKEGVQIRDLGGAVAILRYALEL